MAPLLFPEGLFNSIFIYFTTSQTNVWFIATSHPAGMKHQHTRRASIALGATGSGWTDHGWWDRGWAAEGFGFEGAETQTNMLA